MSRNGYMTLLVLALLWGSSCGGYKSLQKSKPMLDTPWEVNPNSTPTYQEVIAWYEQLAAAFPEVVMQAVGQTDSSYPLHEVVIGGRDADKKVTVMINNAIHPGEPCGVDATMVLVRDLLADEEVKHWLEHVKVVIIPFYNIGGGLNRGRYSRANQDGPEEHGFRGNARYLDLNRDFVKCDSRNALAFTEIFQRHRPEIFLDTHTSNGADYQYTMTLIATQKDKLPKALADYQQSTYLPDIYREMAESDYEMTPYVYPLGTLDNGIKAFLDLPRYSSGYAALHGAISSMPEAHMLKPYKDRVQSTYAFLKANIRHAAGHRDQLLAARSKADLEVKQQRRFDLQWELDRSRHQVLDFRGYEAAYKPSAVSGLSRLYYDHDQPYTRPIDFYDTYRPTVTVEAPAAYVVPFAYGEVIDRLQQNGVEMKVLQQDTVMEVAHYSIEDYKTVAQPYEGHYLHYDVSVSLQPVVQRRFGKGDVIIHLDQVANPYIMHVLEPQGADSFFAWNFFDGILMKKEHFSAYVFEDTAAKLLREDQELNAAFLAKKRDDQGFASDGAAQLEWVYQRSPYFEKGYRRYPVARVPR